MTNEPNKLKGLKITVIGAGPGGLTIAIAAKKYGATVNVLEMADDPSFDQSGYTDRSFNLTLNQVGRKALGDKDAWRGGIRVIGREVHVPGTEKTILSNKWIGDSQILVSIPRSIIRKNMSKLAQKKGVDIDFNTKVTKVDYKLSKIETIKHDKLSYLNNSDLIIIADGVHSLIDRGYDYLDNEKFTKHTEPMRYIQAILDKQACKNLDTNRIHFWHNKPTNSVAIGLPNGNGTIAVLLISSYSDVPENGVPYINKVSAKERLMKEFPDLLELEVSIVDQIVGKKLGKFHYKSIPKYIYGERCVVVGDAGSASPPWAGFGANTAIYGADMLVRFLVGYQGDIKNALIEYEKLKLKIAELVLDYARDHGEFLNKKVADNPDERPIGPVLGQLINQAIKESNVPQGVELLSL